MMYGGSPMMQRQPMMMHNPMAPVIIPPRQNNDSGCCGGCDCCCICSMIFCIFLFLLLATVGVLYGLGKIPAIDNLLGKLKPQQDEKKKPKKEWTPKDKGALVYARIDGSKQLACTNGRDGSKYKLTGISEKGYEKKLPSKDLEDLEKTDKRDKKVWEDLLAKAKK